MSGDALHARLAARPALVAAAVLNVVLATCSTALPAPAGGDLASQSKEIPAAVGGDVRIEGLSAGFARAFKVGYWTPFEVILVGGDRPTTGRVELTVLDGDAVPSRVHVPADGELTIAAGETKSLLLYAKVGQLRGDVVAAFREPNGSVVSRRFSTTDDRELSGILPSDRGLIVTLGGAVTSDDLSGFEQRHTKVARLTSVNELPDEWYGFEGVDAVIVSTSRDETVAELTVDSPRLAALDRWVRLGGKLVLSVGRQAEKALAAESPLAKLAPGTFQSIVPLRQSTVIEAYAEASDPLTMGGGAFVLRVPKLVDLRGKVEAYAGAAARDLPLVVRAPVGFGEVVFVAMDLDEAPLTPWSARGRLFEKLLGRTSLPAADSESSGLGQVTTLGFDDLSGQLRGALDQFAGVELVPFWLVAVLVVAYIVCIGPLDYYIVKRLLRRMEATWITFGLTVVLFSAGAAALAYGLKGRETRINQVNLIDFDASSRLVRGTTWAGLFSPRIDTYDLSLRPTIAADDTAKSRVLFSWLGLPGSGFGGMDSVAGTLPIFTETYDFGGRLDRIERVPIAIWSSKSLVGRWHAQAYAGIEAQLTDRGRLEGTLANRLDVTLEDGVLLYDRWAFPVREFGAGRKIKVNADLDAQTVETFLRHVTVQGDANIALPYDRASFDIDRIIQVASAHDLAGGKKYTQLTHHYQAFVDLSQSVRDGRAVFVGRVKTPAAELERDGRGLSEAEIRQWTFYRFVFEVKQSSE